MPRTLNRHCLSLFNSTLLAYGANCAFVQKEQAQIISVNKTIAGLVVSLEKLQYSKTGMIGMKLVLAAQSRKKMHVHLGPEWILLTARLAITPGDRLLVTGPVIKSGDQAILVAKAIRKGDKKITLLKREKE